MRYYTSYSGGLTSYITGGNPLQGAVQGLVVYFANHLAHPDNKEGKFFKNEKSAYNYMAENTHYDAGKDIMKEQFAWILNDGVLIIPDDYNTNQTSAWYKFYNPRIENGKLAIAYKSKTINPIASIHTHPGSLKYDASAVQNFFGKDVTFADYTKIPAFIMSKENVYAYYKGNYKGNQMRFCKTSDLLNYNKPFYIINTINQLKQYLKE